MAKKPIPQSEEVWRDVIGAEGRYLISSHGRLLGKKSGRIVRLYLNEWGYYSFGSIDNNRKKKCWLIHRLVAKAFISNPEGKLEVNHLDGIKTNNKVSNLEWVTSKENRAHALKVLKVNMGFGARRIKAVVGSRNGEEIYFSSISEADKFGFKSRNISQCCLGIRPTHHGYTWRYA